MKTLIRKALEIAEGEIGTEEDPRHTNRGKEVEAYLRSTGLGPGNPWCAAFVYWCIERAGKDLQVAHPFIRTAACAVIDAWAKQQDIREGRPEPGDVFLRRSTVDGVYRASHTGFVTAVNGAQFKTIEGNTNLGGSRDGYGVFARTRTNGSNYTFVRWERLVPGSHSDDPLFYELFMGEPRSGEKALCKMPLRGGRSLCPIRTWGEYLGFTVEWNNEEQAVLFDGKEVVTEVVLIDGRAHAPIRDLAESAGLQLTLESPRKVRVKRLL